MRTTQKTQSICSRLRRRTATDADTTGHMPRDHTSPEPLESFRVRNVAVNVLHECQVSYEESIVLSLGLNFVPRLRKSKQKKFTEASIKFIR